MSNAESNSFLRPGKLVLLGLLALMVKRVGPRLYLILKISDANK